VLRPVSKQVPGGARKLLGFKGEIERGFLNGSVLNRRVRTNKVNKLLASLKYEGQT
jgi:hypothetical protein